MRRFAVALLAALVLFAPLPAHGQSTPLRIGITQSDCCVEAQYAQDLGLFKKNGVAVEVVPFTSASSLAEAVAAGNVDAGVTTVVQLAEGASRGIPFKIIAAGGIVSRKVPGSALCVAADSKIASAKDLQGQTVAVINLKTTAEFALKEWLQKNGVAPSSVQTIEMPFPQMGPAVQRGTVAAALISEPSLSIAQAREKIRSIAVPTDAIAPQYMVSVWFSTDREIQTRAADLHGFVSTIYETARWANAHQDQSGAILARYAKIDPSVIAKMTRVVYRDRLDVRDINPVLDLAYKYRAIERPMTADALIRQP